MSDLQCPTGMVPIKSGNGVHPDEPTFCIGATEVTQAADAAFWAKRQQSGYELVVTLRGGGTQAARDSSEPTLRAAAAREIKQGNVQSVTVRPVVADPRLQPQGNLAGPQKPAIYRSWFDARTYCQETYPGGDLPTKRQWKQACGSKEYCTASGRLNHQEAIYDVENPANVGTTPANPQGVYDMTGNVWEWTRDDYERGFPYKAVIGGSWFDGLPVNLRAAFRGSYHPDGRYGDVGFRCVAVPQDSKK